MDSRSGRRLLLSYQAESVSSVVKDGIIMSIQISIRINGQLLRTSN